MGCEVNLRFATVEDAQAILELYAPYVETTAVTFEYEVPYLEEMVKRMGKIQKKYPFLVALMQGELVGYAYADAFQERAAYRWAVETTVYVKMEKRREGIGRLLYQTLEELLRVQGILNMNACIACPEREDEYLAGDSAAFHETLGFQLAGKFNNCGYKFHRWYHMIWMEKHIGEHLDTPPDILSMEELRNQNRKLHIVP